MSRRLVHNNTLSGIISKQIFGCIGGSLVKSSYPERITTFCETAEEEVQSFFGRTVGGLGVSPKPKNPPRLGDKGG